MEAYQLNYIVMGEHEVRTIKFNNLRSAMFEANFLHESLQGTPIKIIEILNNKEYNFDEMYKWWRDEGWTWNESI